MAEPQRLLPPFGGAANNLPFVDQAKPSDRGRFVPLEGERNMRPVPTKDGRPQYGTRPGLQKRFPQRFGTDAARRFQMLEVIERASAVTSYELGDATAFTANNSIPKRSELVSLNIGLVDTTSQALRDAFRLYGTAGVGTLDRNAAASAQAVDALPTGVPNTVTPVWAGRHPGSTLAALAYPYVDSVGGTQNRLAVVFIHPATGLFVGCKVIAPADEEAAAPDNQVATAFAWTERALWIARGKALWYIPTPVMGGRARVWQPSSTQALLSSVDPDRPLDAAKTITAMAVVPGTGDVWACFQGSEEAGSYANPAGTITAGVYAGFYRSGLFLLRETADVGTMAYRLATVALASSEELSTDAFVELSSGNPRVHSSFRFSQWLERFPRGAYPTAVAADADGSAYVTFTNQGWGPDATRPPNGSVRYTSVCKVDASGSLVWETDPGTVIGTELGGKLAGVATYYPTDIPDQDGGNAGTTSKDGPALRAVATDSAGLVVVAGRVGTGRWSVYGLSSATGALRWRNRTQGNTATDGAGGTAAWDQPGAAGRGTPRYGVGFDPSDSNVVLAGAHSDTWNDLSASAHPNPWGVVFKLTPDGVISWAMTPTQDDAHPSPVCLAVGEGFILVGSADYTDT